MTDNMNLCVEFLWVTVVMLDVGILCQLLLVQVTIIGLLYVMP